MVNVVSTEDTKNDFYQIAADYVVNYINNMDLNNEIKEKLKLISVNRSILKVPIMTISYNVGLAKMSKELQNKMGKLVEIDDLIVKENKDDINILLHLDSQELEGMEGISGEKNRVQVQQSQAQNQEPEPGVEQRLKNSISAGARAGRRNKTFKIKINKEYSKEEDLFLSPKE